MRKEKLRTKENTVITKKLNFKYDVLLKKAKFKYIDIWSDKNQMSNLYDALA